MLTALYNTQIVSDGNVIAGKAVIIDQDKITDVVDGTDLPAQAQVIDLNGAYVAPGLIDLQIYGTNGYFFGAAPTAETLQNLELSLLKQGCTGFFATIATDSDEVVKQAIEAAKQFRPHAVGCFLGLHLEGPYINALRKGAHPERYIKKAKLAEIRQWIEQAAGEIKMITLAPELQDSEVITYLYQQDVILSCGHSNATYAEAMSFLPGPIKAVTHLYNAMQPMHHRTPGLIPAVFEQKPYTSIVADGIHVDYAMIKLAKRELGNKLFLITDSVAESATGTYQHRFQQDRFVMPDGTLSGSALTMLKAVKNCVQNAGISLAEAVNMASRYPAQLASLNAKGKVEAGYDADLIIFDAGFNPVFTLFKGNKYN